MITILFYYLGMFKEVVIKEIKSELLQVKWSILFQDLYSDRRLNLTSGIFVMKREVLLDVLPIASGHGEFIVEFLHQAELKIKF